MCLAVPGKILSIDDSGETGQSTTATVDFQGTRMPVCLTLTPEDYTLQVNISLLIV